MGRKRVELNGGTYRFGHNEGEMTSGRERCSVVGDVFFSVSLGLPAGNYGQEVRRERDKDNNNTDG